MKSISQHKTKKDNYNIETLLPEVVTKIKRNDTFMNTRNTPFIFDIFSFYSFILVIIRGVNVY